MRLKVDENLPAPQPQFIGGYPALTNHIFSVIIMTGLVQFCWSGHTRFRETMADIASSAVSRPNR
jgi:hypothetical protein